MSCKFIDSEAFISLVFVDIPDFNLNCSKFPNNSLKVFLCSFEMFLNLNCVLVSLSVSGVLFEIWKFYVYGLAI